MTLDAPTCRALIHLQAEAATYSCRKCGRTFQSVAAKRAHKPACRIEMASYREIADAEWALLPDTKRATDDGRKHLESMSPDRRAQLDREWQ